MMRFQEKTLYKSVTNGGCDERDSGTKPDESEFQGTLTLQDWKCSLRFLGEHCSFISFILIVLRVETRSPRSGVLVRVV